jgi:hypothetical protein
MKRLLKKSSFQEHIFTLVLQLAANLKLCLRELNSENTGNVKNMKIFAGTFFVRSK